MKKNEVILKWNLIKEEGNPKETGAYLVTTKMFLPGLMEDDENSITRAVEIFDFKRKYWSDNKEYITLEKPEWICQCGLGVEDVCKNYAIDVVAWAELPEPYGENIENEK